MNVDKQFLKNVKPMVLALKEMTDIETAGTIIAILCDLLQECVKDVDERTLRTIEIKVNDYFSSKYDFEKEEIVKQ